MQRALAVIAICLMYAGSINAAEILLETGIEGFQVDQPAPAELLEKLGPSLGATGSEELRVAAVMEAPDEAELLERWQSPRTIRLVQFIRGREVRPSGVYITFDAWTHAITLLHATFLPDRRLNHEPRLTAAQAKAKAEAQARYLSEPLTFDETSARLAYDFEPVGVRGELVWVFAATPRGSFEPYEVRVSSATGKIIRTQGRWIGCFGEPPGWVDVAMNWAKGGGPAPAQRWE